LAGTFFKSSSCSPTWATRRDRAKQLDDLKNVPAFPPAVCAAAPGVVSILDLPLFTARAG
jgi:hypothetical protein